MNITENIHVVKDSYVNVYLVTGNELAVIDTGDPYTPSRKIFECVKSISREPSEISFIVNTHGHPDHVGGNFLVQSRSSCQVAAHISDIARIENPSLQLEETFKHFKPTAEDIKIYHIIQRKLIYP